MSDQVEVFLDILTDEPNDRISKHILKLLDRLGIKERHFTSGTNHIRAFTTWKETEISTNVKEVENIPHVKTVKARILMPI